MESVKKAIKPHGHFFQKRGPEIFVGLLLFVIGALLLWDAFDGRGKNAPWPFGAIMPW